MISKTVMYRIAVKTKILENVEKEQHRKMGRRGATEAVNARWNWLSDNKF